MKNKILLFIIIFLGFILQTCVEPFEPVIDKYDNLLVIDGSISNFPGPYIVNISRSYPYNEKRPEMVHSANVKIIDDSGNKYILSENESKKGTYETDSNFQAQIGVGYKLQVITPEKNTYESEIEKIKTPMEIDDIYYSLETRYNIEKEIDIIGAQIFLDTHDPENNTRYYAWEYDETWKFGVPFSSPKFYDKTYCFNSYKPKGLIIGTSENLIKDEIKRFPITFVGANTPKLRFKYSILIKQYSLSEHAYQYYKYLKSVNETGGSLFDKTPTSIYGNMHNINDLNEPVLGLFQVSGVSEKRIFIEKKDFDEYFFVEPGFRWCKFEYSDTADTNKTDSLLGFAYIIIDTTTGGQINFTKDSACFDCTQTGTNVVPDFWEE
ncbi:DUF4249 domain-containing protein [Bacteroidota bacterium]